MSYGTAGYFFTQILPRVAVPFFFVVAGYYYIGALMDGKKIFFKYIKKLLIVYSAWSVVYFSMNFCIVMIKGENILRFLKRCVLEFFITGSYYHFWFFPALIFSVCVITFVYKAKLMRYFYPVTVVLYMIGCLGCSYYEVGNHIPFFKEFLQYPQLFTLIRRVVLMGLPFFSMGYLLQKFRHRTSKWNNGKLFLATVSVMVLYLLEIAVVVYCRLQDNIVITPMLYLLVYMLITILLNNRLLEHKTVAELLRKIANFTYYSHPIIILLCGVFGKVTNIKLTQTPTFVVTWILTFVAGFIIAKLNKKWLNQMIM